MTETEISEVINRTILAEDARQRIVLEPGLAIRLCRIFDDHDNDWFLEDGPDSWTGIDEESDSGVFSVGRALEILSLQMMPPGRLLLIPQHQPPPTLDPDAVQIAAGGTDPIRLTKDQCREHLDELVRKQCYCWDTREGYFKEPLGNGYTRNKEEAHRCTVPVGIGHYSAFETMIELVDQEIAARIAAVKFNVKTLLGLSIVEMLKMAPLNLTARAKVMSVVGVMPPRELDTWDKIKEWVGDTYQPKSPEKPKSPPLVPRQIFEVPVMFSDTETGTCNYSVSRSSRNAFQVESEDIRRIVIDNDITSIGSLIYSLHRHIQEEAHGQLEPEMYSSDDREYDDYEIVDYCDSSVDLPSGINQERFTSWLRSTQSEEILALLGIPTPF